MTIATNVWIIAEQRDNEYLTNIKDEFFCKLKSVLQEKLKNFEPWEDKKEKFTLSHSDITSLQRATKDLGFIVEPCENGNRFYISIQKQVEGQKANFAQKMLSDFEEKLKEHINSEKSKAKTEYEKIVELLENKKFESYFYGEDEDSKSFKISVKKSPEKLFISAPFSEELKRLLEIEGFYNLSFNSCTNSWDFVVKKEL